MKKLAVLFVTLALGATACGTDETSRPPINKPGDPPQSVSDLPECRNVESTIAGQTVSIYRARSPEADFFVLVLNDDPKCATDEEGVNDSGVIPGDAPVEAAKCPICDGEPMPAIQFPGLQ